MKPSDISTGQTLEVQFELPAIGATKTITGLVTKTTQTTVNLKVMYPTRVRKYTVDPTADDGEQIAKENDRGESMGSFGPIYNTTILE